MTNKKEHLHSYFIQFGWFLKCRLANPNPKPEQLPRSDQW